MSFLSNSRPQIPLPTLVSHFMRFVRRSNIYMDDVREEKTKRKQEAKKKERERREKKEQVTFISPLSYPAQIHRSDK